MRKAGKSGESSVIRNKLDPAMTALGFSEQEVERAKAAWLQERKTSLRQEKSFAGTLVEGLYTGLDYAWLAQYDEKIARLTAQEVTLALRKYLADAPIVWMIGRGS